MVSSLLGLGRGLGPGWPCLGTLGLGQAVGVSLHRLDDAWGLSGAPGGGPGRRPGGRPGGGIGGLGNWGLLRHEVALRDPPALLRVGQGNDGQGCKKMTKT